MLNPQDTRWRGRTAPRIANQYIDIQETMKGIVSSNAGDDYAGIQRTSTGTLGGDDNQTIGDAVLTSAPPDSSIPGLVAERYAAGRSAVSGLPAITQSYTAVSQDFAYFNLDTRAADSENRAGGTIVYDLLQYLVSKTKTRDLPTVVEARIMGRFFIPKPTSDETLVFKRILMTIQELSTGSNYTSSDAGPIYHFEFVATDTGLGQVELTPLSEPFYLNQPLRMDKATITFYTPTTKNSFIPLQPESFLVTYNSNTPTTTTFDAPLGHGVVVGEVAVFTTNSDALRAASPLLFRAQGFFVVAVLPLTITISGAFALVVPPGATISMFPSSRIIRIPLRFRTIRGKGGGNFTVPSFST